jgi:hypothetical protein
MRANRAREGLTAAGIAESRAGRAQRTSERNEDREGNRALVRAELAVGDAESALGRATTAQEREAAQGALAEARRRYSEAIATAGESGARVATTIRAQRAADQDRDAQREGRAAELSGPALTAYNDAAGEFRTNNTTRGTGVDPAAMRVLQSGQEIARLNRGADPGTALETALQIARNPNQWRPVAGGATGVVRNESGVTFRLPESWTRPRSTPGAGGGSDLPAAPTETGGGGMGGARTPPAASPMSLPRSPSVQAAENFVTGGGSTTPRGTPPLDVARSTAQALIERGRPRTEAIQEAVRASRGSVTRQQLERALAGSGGTNRPLTGNAFPR